MFVIVSVSLFDVLAIAIISCFFCVFLSVCLVGVTVSDAADPRGRCSVWVDVTVCDPASHLPFLFTPFRARICYIHNVTTLLLIAFAVYVLK